MFSRQYLGTNNPAEILSETDMKYMSLLDEKSKRRFLATKAISLGCHGVTWVAEASRVNRDTIYKGIHELKADEQTRHPLSSYCSKYAPIEHRMFAPITRSWSGAPLLSVEIARQRAASTKTSKGLKVYTAINNKSYETKRTIESTFEADKQKFIIFDDCLPK